MTVSVVAVPLRAILDGPAMQWNHVDGPLLTWAGHLHWLTWRERFRIAWGIATVDTIAGERFPGLAEIRLFYLDKPQPARL